MAATGTTGGTSMSVRMGPLTRRVVKNKGQKQVGPTGKLLKILGSHRVNDDQWLDGDIITYFDSKTHQFVENVPIITLTRLQETHNNLKTFDSQTLELKFN
jgi:hypothetical protein